MARPFAEHLLEFRELLAHLAGHAHDKVRSPAAGGHHPRAADPGTRHRDRAHIRQLITRRPAAAACSATLPHKTVARLAVIRRRPRPSSGAGI